MSPSAPGATRAARGRSPSQAARPTARARSPPPVFHNSIKGIRHPVEGVRHPVKGVRWLEDISGEAHLVSSPPTFMKWGRGGGNGAAAHRVEFDEHRN